MVHYSWYQEGELLHHVSDLQIHCGIVLQDSHFYCVGMNAVSQQESDIISVQVLKSTDGSCIYVIQMGTNMLDFVILKLVSLGFFPRMDLIPHSPPICKNCK